MLKDIKDNWEEFARVDPLWSILPEPDKKNNRWTIQELFHTGEIEIRSVMEQLAQIPVRRLDGRALDFGCGVGRLSQALAGYFQEVWGVDISCRMIELAEKYNLHPDRCRFLVNDQPDLRLFPDDYFDFIYSNIVFQHIPPALTFGYLKEFLRIIKTGGIVVFQMTTRPRFSLGTLLRLAFNRLAPPGLRRIYKQKKYGTWAIKDMYCISEETIRRHLAAHGGQVLAAVDDQMSLPRFLGKRYVVTRK